MSLAHLTDFPDKLSPMLVKELRQGMRARGFTILFLSFQAMLAVILLSASAFSGTDSAGSFASGVIFTVFIITALIIQPMRGVNALSAEITGNTIEMMVLTRLSAWRIVFGKWIAIVSQTALIVITIIPYLILRYFFGGMILLGEMVFLTLIFLTSMALTAVLVGLSGTTTKIFRVLPILAIVFFMNVVPRFLFTGGFSNFMDYCTLSNWDSRIAIFSYVCFISYLGWCALSFGTSVIAPVAENHSTIRRLIALGLTCIVAVLGALDWVDHRVLPLIFGIILAPAVITALTEPSIMLPPIYKPFLKRGLPGKIASVVLLPGWPSGVFYGSLLLAISLGAMALTTALKPYTTYDNEALIMCLAVIGAVLLPALLAANFSKSEDTRMTNFIVFLLLLVLFSVVPANFTNINDHEKYLWLFIWNPLIFIPMMKESGFMKDQLLTAIIIVDFIILILLWITAAIAFRGYREVFAETEKGLAEETATAPET
jgi:hypothetical protein